MSLGAIRLVRARGDKATWTTWTRGRPGPDWSLRLEQPRPHRPGGAPRRPGNLNARARRCGVPPRRTAPVPLATFAFPDQFIDRGEERSEA